MRSAVAGLWARPNRWRESWPLRVLRYLPTNLRGPEIASELFVSQNTIRAHLRNVYAKLGVHSRADALKRARELGLLSRSSLRC